MTDEIWSVTFVCGWPNQSYVSMEVFKLSLEDAQKAAMRVREIVESVGMTFLWSQVAKVTDDIVTMEDNYYENVVVH